jgi:hypothetical protein
LNAAGASSCRLCGRPLEGDHHPANREMPACISCGAHVHEGTDRCTACGRPLREVIKSNLPEGLPEEACVHWSERAASAGRTAKVSVAGILILMAGFLGIAQALLSHSPEISEGFMRTLEEAVPGMESVDNLLADYVVLQALVFVFGAVAIFGSMFVMTRSRFDMAVIGAVFGIIAVGYIFGALLSLVGLLFVITARKEFLSECG